MKIIHILKITFFLLISCNSNSQTDENFKIENDKLIQDYKNVTQKFIEKSAYNLSDESMANALDSIARVYMVDKNKRLAEEFINTQSGLKRLNFLKKFYTKVEIKKIIEKIPENLKTNVYFIELENYSGE